MVSCAITAVGTATPPGVDHEDLWNGFFAGHFAGSRIAGRIFSGAGVRRRHTVADPRHEDISGWTTAARMRRYAEQAPPLGHRAVTRALAGAGLAPEDVGLLTVASCTGYSTPGLDIELAASLGLRPDAQRLLVGHMGCYAALPALRGTADYVRTHRRPAVLLCLELTSLHLQPPTTDPQQVVCHALFGDAAAAVVLQPGPPGGGPGPAAAPGLGVVDTASLTDPSGRDEMTWTVTDHGFRMGLTARVPDILAKHVRPAVEDLLHRNGLALPDVAGWAVHPGGPRILDTVETELALPAEALGPSRAVLAELGNCSSPTVLLILDRLLRNGAPPPGSPVVAMAFGPGLTLCATLLRTTGPGGPPLTAPAGP
ncbi:hypothetical protein GCM10009716_11590 [Streptomyces sodiiphilus]|uniref:Type III polyketide synthase n=1 Tax=Streptomyces sodiiphilus TaxID=226217 RepID=A0ABN2NWM9_9ACTN